MRFGNRLRQERLRRHLSQEALAEALALSARSIRRWEQGQALPQASVRLQLSRFFGLRLEDLFGDQETQAPPTPLWYVPYPRNPFFTGRDDILASLHTSLSIDQEAVYTQVYALHGLGGVGKTQIALEYAYRSARKYRAIFWVRAETAESIAFDVRHVADVLQLPEQDDKDRQRVIMAVRNWLTLHDQWLLICDNVEDLNVLDHVLPAVRHGATLLTTRLQTLGTRGRSIHVSPMEHEEGMLLLLRRAKVLEAEATSEQIRQLAARLPSQYEAATGLFTVMGGLPLALDQAGAYLEETQCGLSAYLELFSTRRTLLLQRRGEGVQDHPASVSTTFTLAIMATAERHPAVLDLLRVCALLQPDAIPEELFRQEAEYLGETLKAVSCEALDWNQVVAAACSYSLLSRQAEAQTFSIHRLVQAILLDSLTEAEREEWNLRVLHALDVIFPEISAITEYFIWKQCERLLPHALLCLHRVEAAERSLALASLASKVAQYLRERGQYGEAEPLYQRAFHIREQVLGPDHPQVATSLNNLAVLYWREGKYGEAEPLYRRALSILEQVPGSEHLQKAGVLTNLANLYRDQGKYVEAEPLCLRSLHVYEQVLDPDHLQLALPLNNLATLYASQGKYTEAGPLFLRALHIWEQSLGPEHPVVAQALHNLAELYRYQGKSVESGPLFQRALSLREQHLGLHHPETAQTLHDLALLYRDQGKYVEAEPLFQRALHIWEQALGHEHRLAAQALHNLAELYRYQSKYAEAESLYQRALRISEQSQGAEHGLMPQALTGLANLYCHQGKYVEAKPLYRQALHIQEQVLGPTHPETAETLHDLGIFFQKQGELYEAFSLVERALKIRSQSLGEDHPKTKATQALYVQLVQDQEQRKKGVFSQHCGEETLDQDFSAN
ncbi:helix-turn-helix transcriptional regulator [Ktedonobacter racemifer]|uniref:Transcriptional regulator, XRE family n=1 Tax=Ktedonobacter racemifer DSM 44963 TaxID=485913 RepID=D6TBW8_KTERA|nr:helix-turn-helix transcriptional regulator [Ktedonobacter racemifer]EFH89900.1 transcriptional regulator, XRE family [Ktedonobacter racemifer DSM 44963]